MLSPAGERVLQRVSRVTTLQIGPVRVVDLPVNRLAGELLKAARDVDGIVGQDVLAVAAYTIDYRRRTVVWHPGGTIPDGTRLRLDLTDGRAMVSLPPGPSAQGALRMIPDTGADSIVLFARSGRPLPPVTPLDIALLRTVSGVQLVRRVLLERFSAGDIELGDVTASLVNRRDTAEIDGDGLLPLHLFSAVTLDARNGVLVLQR